MSPETPIPPLRAVETIPVQQDGQEYLVLRDPQGFSDNMIAISLGTLPILAHLDGNHSAAEIAGIVQRENGIEVEPRQVLTIAEMLDNARLLNSEDFIRHRLAREEEWRTVMVREPVLAGGGYPADPVELEAELSLLSSAPPPEDFAPEKPLPAKRLRGLIVPHIDFHRGGKSYGRLYRLVSNLLPPREDGPLLIVVIGVAHSGAFESVVATEKDFRTPLGGFACDRAALATLREQLGDGVLREEFIHKMEHSIEIQLPWLQHILRDREATFLPLLAGILDSGGNGGTPADSPGTARLLEALRTVEQRHPGPVLWLASVDFAHVGPAFGDPAPVSERDQSLIERKDMKALEAVRQADAEAWWRELNSDGNSHRICGMNAVYLLLALLKGCRGRVIDYQQALSEDRKVLVSHAAAILQDLN